VTGGKVVDRAVRVHGEVGALDRVGARAIQPTRWARSAPAA
jgi:hypothetical protein